MTATVQDILNVNLVLLGLQLLDTPKALTAFRELAGTDVQIAGTGLVLDAPGNAMGTGKALILNKDRISLELSPNRSIITREYPSSGEPGLGQDLDRFSEVATLAMSNTDVAGKTLQAIGYNIELVYEQTLDSSAFRYLADRLLQVDSICKPSWKLVGGSGKLSFQDGDKSWNVAIEPRLNDRQTNRVYLSLNLHRDQQATPTRDEIRESLYEAWHEASEIVTRLDKR